MEPNKEIAIPGYALAILLFFFPLADVIVPMYPFRFGDVKWRFGAIGSLGNVTLLPLLALFIALAVATMVDHRKVRRVLGQVCGVFAVIFGLMIVLFMLDFFQVRSQLQRQMMRVVDVAATGSLIKQTLTLLVLVLLARLGLSGRGTSRLREAPAATDTPTQTPLITRPGAARAE